jgi:hypothetical protein
MLTDFIVSLCLPLQEPLVESIPIRRVSRRVSPLVPRLSIRLAVLTHHRDPRPEIQAKKVMLRKWRPVAMPPSPQEPRRLLQREVLLRLPGAIVLHARAVPEPVPADCSSGA